MHKCAILEKGNIEEHSIMLKIIIAEVSVSKELDK